MKTADKIIKSQAIFTSLGRTPFPGAVAISGNKILGVIRNDIPDEWIGDSTKIYDCGNKLVMPGFIDAHTHFFMRTAASGRYMNMNIDKSTISPYGEVVKGQDGEPNGILLEGAGLVALEKLSDFPTEVMREIYRDFFRSVAEKGITSLSDMTITEMSSDYINLLNHLKQMEKDGDITARLNMYSRLGETEQYDQEIALRKKYGKDGIVRYAGFKHLVDGVTSTFTGLLLEPYSDRQDTAGDPANYEKSYYLKYVAQANAAGIGVRLHCIGDRAVRWALDSFEEANRVTRNRKNHKKLKNSIEHIETIHPDDIPRFKKLGVIASTQPYHLTLDNNEKIRRCGKARCRWEWPHRSLLDAGAILAFGTDYPIVSFDPFENIYAAVTRKDDARKPTGINPEEKISLAETLICYTINGAYVYDMESELGTLETGKLADIIVIDRNMFDISEEEIPDCKIQYTFFNGKEIYAKDDI